MIFQLVMPAYNEAESLADIAQIAIGAAMERGWEQGQFQLVIVNNGSTDNSARVLDELTRGEAVPWLKVVTVTQNKGYGDGIWQGLQATTADYVGWTHADEQCHPADAFLALEKLVQLPDKARTLLKGKRFGRTAFDYVWSRCFELAAFMLLRVPMYEINAQPKVFPRALLNEIKNPPTDFAFDLYVLYQAKKSGWNIQTVPVKLAPRAHGESRWAHSFKSRMRTSMKMLRYIHALSKTR